MGVQFYLLALEQPVEIIHAHRYQTAHYKMELQCLPGCCEITYIERGQIQRGDGFAYQEGSGAVLLRDAGMHLRSDSPAHSHSTVAFYTGAKPVPMTVEDVAKWKPVDHCVILPEQLPPGKSAEEAQKVLRKIITTVASVDPGRFLALRAEVYHLFALLTEASVTAAAAMDSRTALQNQHYCRLAVEYLTDHIADRISAADVAAHTGVSYGYLSRIFRAGMGMTLVEYSNCAKVQRVRELITSRNISLTDAGLAVGIDDVKYLSRLFKKYSGVTSAEYRELNCHSHSPLDTE